MSAAATQRAQVAFERANRIAGRLLRAAIVISIAGGLLWFAQRPRFDFHRIVVRGDALHITRQTLRQATAGRLAGNYFTIDLAAARRVFEAVPWVAQASVRRVWPDRLVVTLTEHRPIGLWSDGRLLSDRGVLFDANPAEAEAAAVEAGRAGLVEFSGPARDAGEAARRLHDFEQTLARCGLAVAAIDVSDRAAWSIQARGGPRLELGRDDPAGTVDRRLAEIVARYPTLVQRLNATPLRIDARYPNGLAVAVPQT